MDITQILEIFSNPETISTLEKGDLVSAILVTLLMGMGTTVVVLTLLMFCTSLMSRILKASVDAEVPTSTSPAAAKPSGEDEELAVVLASAVAAMLNTSADRIAVRNIKKI